MKYIGICPNFWRHRKNEEHNWDRMMACSSEIAEDTALSIVSSRRFNMDTNEEYGKDPTARWFLSVLGDGVACVFYQNADFKWIWQIS